MHEEEEEDHHKTDSLGNTIIKPPHHKPDLSLVPPSLNVNDLPPEILIQIFTNLDPICLNTLRLVCKKWNYVINDRETWMKSFQLKFNIPMTSSTFPSISHSSNWMNEYFTRLHVIKNWKRGNSVHKIYQMINNEQRYNDVTLVDFNMNKILIYDKKFNNISIGNLSDGKNQSYIPGSSHGFQTNILCCDINWNYLVTGLKNGEIHLKNLYTSTSVSQRSSVLKFNTGDDDGNSPIMSLLMSNEVIISGSYNGVLRIWNLQGSKLKEIAIGEVIYNISSDFKKYVIINTDRTVIVLDYQTGDIFERFELGFIIGEEESEEYDVLIKHKNKMDVDYGSQQVIISYKSIIKAFNFVTHGERQLHLPQDVEILESHFQTATTNKFINRNTNLVGRDGLLYGNLLSDGSIIVWNVRDESTTIIPMIKIYPELNHKKYSNGINNAIVRHGLLEITSFSFTGSIIAVGGFNGLTNLYDVYSGKFLREISIKFPKRFPFMHDSLVPITSIKLNPNQLDNNGIIICGDTVQYFEFGEIKQKQQQQQQQTNKQLNNGSQNKNEHKKKIRDGIEDYDHQQYEMRKHHELLDKYNGTTYEDEEEEYMMALAISESLHNSSRDTSTISSLGSPLTSNNDDDMMMINGLDEEEVDEELKRVLQLSLIEH
ncbi:UFO1 Ubiquitin ligase complex F-box protein UFO1 [Candida maltosa Xu316]